jgi:serine/threonine protein kinase
LPKVWVTLKDDYKLLGVLGEGSYGQVVKGMCRVSKQTVAIKFIKNICESEYDCVKVIREI